MPERNAEPTSTREQQTVSEPTKTYVVKPGYTHGAENQYKAGDTIELTDAEYKGIEDKLELQEDYEKRKQEGSDVTPELQTAVQNSSDEQLAAALGVDLEGFRQLRSGRTAQRTFVTSPERAQANQPTTKQEAVNKVETQLERETGSDFVQTGSDPATLAETDRTSSRRSK